MSEHVEVTRRGLGSRGKDSIGGALFGLILVLVGTYLLFWNEGRAVKRYKDLIEGAGAVVSIASDRVDPAMEGKLVHLSGETKTQAPLLDEAFGVTAQAVKLIREAEMYQWVEIVRTETKEKIGGSSEEVKTYTYEKEWRSSPVDSNRFKVPANHRNPTEMRFQGATLTARPVIFGAFTLPDFLVARIGGARLLSIDTLENSVEEVRSVAKLDGGLVYFGNDPKSPVVGDLRVRFLTVPTGPASVVAQQAGSTFVPYTTKTGGSVELLESGLVGPAEMFQMAQDRNKRLTWAIRVGGFFLLAIAFSMILRPIAVLASILPFLGRLVGTGTTIVAFLLAGIVWGLTVSIAWILHRPLLGVVILVGTAFLLFLIVKRVRRPAGPPSLQATPPPLV